MRDSSAVEVVLLGAAGFVGRACVHAALQKKDHFTLNALYRKPLKVCNGVHQIIGDIQNFDPAWLPEKPHVIVHLAVKQIDHDQTGFDPVNVAGTMRILQNLNEHTRGIIYNSSMSVYGQNAQINIRENALCLPTTALSRSRRAAEELILQEAERRKISALVLRPRFVIGSGDNFVLPKLKALAQRRMTLNNGYPQYSVIHVDDYAEIILALANTLSFTHEPIRQALNIGYKEPVSLKDILFGLSGADAKLSIPVHAAVLKALHRIPNPNLDQIATRLELVGLSHFGNTEKLRNLINLPLLQRSPKDALKQAINEL